MGAAFLRGIGDVGKIIALRFGWFGFDQENSGPRTANGQIPSDDEPGVLKPFPGEFDLRHFASSLPAAIGDEFAVGGHVDESGRGMKKPVAQKLRTRA